jgi:hypothetical protein
LNTPMQNCTDFDTRINNDFSSSTFNNDPRYDPTYHNNPSNIYYDHYNR